MGIVYSLFVETFPGTPRWPVDDLSDLSGQVVIVTGGNSGIGLELCKVYMTARDRERAERAIENLQLEASGRSPIFIELDLVDLASASIGQELQVLYNNAHWRYDVAHGIKTANGYDLQFGKNVLGPYLFTTLLLPTLIHTAQASPLAGGTARARQRV
ncbi:hypothetical protein B0J17DRAFT_713176 [Rhizoctonia solani]|nr:hypothetical protein B0J17DRAFT_713176 [Rhizoctonia solani]